MAENQLYEKIKQALEDMRNVHIKGFTEPYAPTGAPFTLSEVVVRYECPGASMEHVKNYLAAKVCPKLGELYKEADKELRYEQSGGSHTVIVSEEGIITKNIPEKKDPKTRILGAIRRRP